jgi:hypothetical protein
VSAGCGSLKVTGRCRSQANKLVKMIIVDINFSRFIVYCGVVLKWLITYLFGQLKCPKIAKSCYICVNLWVEMFILSYLRLAKKMASQWDYAQITPKIRLQIRIESRN